MKTIFCVVVLTVVFIIGMVAIEKQRTKGLNEIDLSYQSALLQIGGSASTDKSDDKQDSSSTPDIIEVTISGEVKKEGKYQMDYEAYLSDLLKEVGGVTSLADEQAYNGDYVLQDGDSIYIPKTNNGNKISINTADSAALDLLPGIGETLAKRIIDYRDANGEFQALEQLMKVEGIGKSIFDKIKDLIRL